MHTDGASEGVHRELSHAIIGPAMTVINVLKPGLDEKLYERALVLELRALAHQVEQQKIFPVLYRGQTIGSLVPDMIVDGQVIVDPKVAEAFHESHLAQMLGYLAITDLKLALLLNFKHARLQVKRVVRDR
jgi:GxxExxY protein